MKKTNKKALTASLLSACALLVAAGFGSVNSSTAQASGSTFEMIGGASIRVDNNTDDNVDERGLRFSSEISVSEFEALDDNGGTVTAGTFIMPYDYIATNGALNEQTCFGVGGNAVYTWDGKTVAGGEKKILHVAALPYKTVSEADKDVEVYRINGSVVTLKEENLNRSYVGVSYIAVTQGSTVTYTFATTDTAVNQRSALRVAQNILAKSTTSDDAAVAKYYLDTYLEDGVDVTVKNEVYVNASTGYAARSSANLEQTLTLEDWEDVVNATATVPTLDGYAYVQGLSEEMNLDLSDGATTVVKHYYDEMHDNVIFDGSLETDKEDVFAENGISITANASFVEEYEGWGWRGNKSLKLSNWGTGWVTIEFPTPIRFSQPVNKISFMVRNSENKAPKEEAVESNKMEIYFNDGWVKDTVSVKPGAGEIYELTYNLTPQTTLFKMEIKVDARHYNENVDAIKYQEHEIYIDYIHAEYDLYLDGVDYFTEVSETNKNTELEVDFSKLDSTVYSDEELASASIAPSYRTLPATDSTTLTLTDNKVRIRVAANNNYEVDFGVTVGGTPVSGKFNVLGYYDSGIWDFETGEKTTVDGVFNIDSKNSLTGSNSVRVISSNKSWSYIENSEKPLSGDTKLCMWIYSNDRCTMPKGGDQGWIWSSSFSYTAKADDLVIAPGWNYYEFDISASSVSKIGFLDTVMSAATDNKDAQGNIIGSPNHYAMAFDRISIK